MDSSFSHVPPGFRFHPTDEELVDYYLRKKISSRRIDLDVIKDVDLYKIEPWDLQEICRIGGAEEQSDWYFFSHKDKKYPTGTRTNRATAAGFWKATGRDKAIYSKHDLIGMRKTLVFYKGRAPNGQKSDWIMHEYRLETDENATPQEEGWVVCRVFKKRIGATMRRVVSDESPIWYEDHVSFMADMENSSKQRSQSNQTDCHYPYPACKKEIMNLYYQNIPPTQHDFLQLPLLESPKLLPPPANSISAYGLMSMASGSTLESSSAVITQLQEQYLLHQSQEPVYDNNILIMNNEQAILDQAVTDWRVLDKFVASQLSQDEVLSKESDYSNTTTNTFTTASDDSNFLAKQLEKQDWE